MLYLCIYSFCPSSSHSLEAFLVHQVKGVLDKEEVLRAKNNGWLFACHVVVGTPQCLAELATPPEAFPLAACLRALAVDEVDAYPKVHLSPAPMC